jgi:sugar lactone lactonase YvrE
VRYGSNGIKVRNGWVYVGVMSRKEIVRVRLTGDGRPSGPVEKFAAGFVPDDFDIAPDGSLYGTSMGETKMYKVSPAGKVSVLLEGIPGAAATLVSRDGRWLYWPTRTKATPARLLRTAIQ